MVSLAQKMNHKLLRNRDTLLLSGGGLKTLAFCGTLECMDLSGFSTIAGISAGSMLGLCLCMGYEIKEAKTTLIEADLVGALADSISPSGFFSGHSMLDQGPLAITIAKWMRGKGIAADISFSDLYLKTGRIFRVVACKTGLRPQLAVFDAESTPKVQVLRAVLASTAVPIAFAPVCIDGVFYSDAGVVNNLSLFSCDPDRTVALLVGENSHSSTTKASPSTSVSLFAEMALKRMGFLSHCELKVYGRRAAIIHMPVLPGPDFHIFRLGNGTEHDLDLVIQQGRDALHAFLNAPILLCFICILVAQGGFKQHGGRGPRPPANSLA
jgi:predicted acylesterase/phospholipase RssA